MGMKYTDLHYGQIPTLYKTIRAELSKSGTSAIFHCLDALHMMLAATII